MYPLTLSKLNTKLKTETININNNIIDYTESAELDDLKNKRNYIIVEEIKRLTKHIKFLEKLIK